MNKLRTLLSAGAMLSLVAGTANAGRLMDMQGDSATPTGTGLVTTGSGFQEMGGPYTGGQGLEGEGAAPFSKPAPGTINMRINSFVNEFPMAEWWSGMNGSGTPAANAGNKQQGYGIYGWIRIDLGIDGQTKTGIKYGAFTEIRENNTTAISGGPTSATSGFGQSASGDSSDNILYVRHANVYLGTDELGFIRVGTAIAAQTLYETGLNDNFDIGGWISFASTAVPGNVAPTWPWADEGGEYMAARIGYYSPVIDGFDFGVAFAPNNSTPFDGSGCSEPYGGTYCATQSSSTSAADQGRYRNEVGIALRYRNTFGPVGMDLAGIWTTSGVVNNATGPNVYKGFNIGDVGIGLSYDKMLHFGGNIMFGDYNGNWNLEPVGGSSAFAYVVGVQYTMLAMPMTIGTYYFNYRYNGLSTVRPVGVGQRTSQGLDVGAVYGMGPGVVLIAEYAWGQNNQSGFDFLTNALGTGSNTVTAQVATVGMSVRF